MAIHAYVARLGFGLKLPVANTLVDLYFKCGSADDGVRLFESLRKPDVISWTTVMLAYTRSNQGDLALQFFGCMQAEGCQPDRSAWLAAVKACSALPDSGKIHHRLEKAMAVHAGVVSSGYGSDAQLGSGLVDMYAKLGSMTDARAVFDKVSRRDGVHWNALMFGYAENGEAEAALEVFSTMEREGFSPNCQSYVAALKACGSLAELQLGKNLHAGVVRLGIATDPAVAVALLHFYAKCGSMVEAERVAESMVKRDVVAWNALLAGFGSGEEAAQVFQGFRRMQEEGVRPDGITFLGILSACSCAGLVDKGRRCFETMWPRFGVAPTRQHYHCLIDMLGRANKMEDAVAVVELMPFEPNDITWTTVLDACRSKSL